MIPSIFGGIPGIVVAPFIDFLTAMFNPKYSPTFALGKTYRSVLGFVSTMSQVKARQQILQPVTIKVTKITPTLLTKDQRIMSDEYLNFRGYIGDVLTNFKFKPVRSVIPKQLTTSSNTLDVKEGNILSTNLINASMSHSALENCIPSSDCKLTGKVGNLKGTNSIAESIASSAFKRVLGKTLGLLLLSTMRIDLLEASG